MQKGTDGTRAISQGRTCQAQRIGLCCLIARQLLYQMKQDAKQAIRLGRLAAILRL